MRSRGDACSVYYDAAAMLSDACLVLYDLQRRGWRLSAVSQLVVSAVNTCRMPLSLAARGLHRSVLSSFSPLSTSGLIRIES